MTNRQKSAKERYANEWLKQIKDPESYLYIQGQYDLDYEINQRYMMTGKGFEDIDWDVFFDKLDQNIKLKDSMFNRSIKEIKDEYKNNSKVLYKKLCEKRKEEIKEEELKKLKRYVEDNDLCLEV